MSKQNIYSIPSNPNRFADLTVIQLNKTEQESVIQLAINVLSERHRPGKAITSPNNMRRYLRVRLRGRYNEIFGVMFLDNRRRIIADEELFQGTINGTSVYPRVVVQRALSLNAAIVILYHNHPSGVAEPSSADKAITKRLQDALALVDIRILDHLVVGDEEVISFAEKGLL